MKHETNGWEAVQPDAPYDIVGGRIVIKSDRVVSVWLAAEAGAPTVLLGTGHSLDFRVTNPKYRRFVVEAPAGATSFTRDFPSSARPRREGLFFNPDRPFSSQSATLEGVLSELRSFKLQRRADDLARRGERRAAAAVAAVTPAVAAVTPAEPVVEADETPPA